MKRGQLRSSGGSRSFVTSRQCKNERKLSEEMLIKKTKPFFIAIKSLSFLMIFLRDI